jgi:hypothetical protein
MKSYRFVGTSLCRGRFFWASARGVVRQ